MLLLIDNFDSFTYNLVQAFETLGVKTKVIRHDACSVDECLKLDIQHLVISPGPGAPNQAGISNSLIQAMAGKVPILGVCLGHQCIGEVFGGRIIRAQAPMHGKISRIRHDGKGAFKALPQGFSATRYHSLVIEKHSLPNCLEISAETEEGEIMGIRHRHLPMEGVQFHPESVMTQYGLDLLQNFINQHKE